MAAIFSTRMDEALIERLDRVAKNRGMTKKKIVENALRTYLDSLGEDDDADPLEASFGAWERDETAEETVDAIRERMRKAIRRRSP